MRGPQCAALFETLYDQPGVAADEIAGRVIRIGGATQLAGKKTRLGACRALDTALWMLEAHPG